MPEPSPIMILAVDDEELVMNVLVAALEDGGYEVSPASSAEQAFKILDERAPVLGGVVTDVNLGRDLSGWDVGRHARGMNPNMPIVYISGDSAHEWAAHGVPHSILLQKPFAPADLIVALASLRQARSDP